MGPRVIIKDGRSWRGKSTEFSKSSFPGL